MKSFKNSNTSPKSSKINLGAPLNNFYVIMGEYNNKRFHDPFASSDITFHFSFPHTSQQNGRSERMIRTINNMMWTLLFHSHLLAWSSSYVCPPSQYLTTPPPSLTISLTIASFITTLHTTIFACLVVFTFLTFFPVISYNPALPCAPSSATPHTTVGYDAMICHLERSSSLITLHLTSRFSHMARSLPSSLPPMTSYPNFTFLRPFTIYYILPLL